MCNKFIISLAVTISIFSICSNSSAATALPIDCEIAQKVDEFYTFHYLKCNEPNKSEIFRYAISYESHKSQPTSLATFDKHDNKCRGIYNLESKKLEAENGQLRVIWKLLLDTNCEAARAEIIERNLDDDIKINHSLPIPPLKADISYIKNRDKINLIITNTSSEPIQIINLFNNKNKGAIVHSVFPIIIGAHSESPPIELETKSFLDCDPSIFEKDSRLATYLDENHDILINYIASGVEKVATITIRYVCNRHATDLFNDLQSLLKS